MHINIYMQACDRAHIHILIPISSFWGHLIHQSNGQDSENVLYQPHKLILKAIAKIKRNSLASPDPQLCVFRLAQATVYRVVM